MIMSIKFFNKADARGVVQDSTTVTVYEVHWGWVALSVNTVLGGTIFVLLTTLSSGKHRLPRWKPSSLSISVVRK
ncbi:hypothetical protein BCR34DRAFT_556338, partial [Clohesyomyces aquaticus]